MEFSINPQMMFGLSFSVPAAVVDKHLKLAGAAQIKVLLWLLRHAAESPTMDELCNALNMKSADATDAMQYWVECGIVLENGKVAKAEDQPEYAKPAKENTPVEIKSEISYTRPTSEQILKRTKESAEIQFMFNEAQKKLGRTIGYDGQSTLLMIHDFYGLPVEVLLMLIEYCVSIGKNSLGYISKAAKTWSEKEIDSLEKADEQIHLLRRCDGTWKKLCELTGISTPRPTASQSSYLAHWTNELKFDIDMIYLAYEEMANHTDKISFPYMNKVLQNWSDQGIRSPHQVEEAKEQRAAEKAKPAQKKKSTGYEASYDIDEFDKKSATTPLIYKKNSSDEGEV
ncbi:MAG: DnaD domain protein [Clostridia bacterium]|nr:DnaD domain protein [Clostridia bacterium]